MTKRMTKRQRLDALEALAIELHGTEDIEVDQLKPRGEISEGADGIWVRAWVHISNSHLKAAGINNPQGVEDDDD